MLKLVLTGKGLEQVTSTLGPIVNYEGVWDPMRPKCFFVA